MDATEEVLCCTLLFAVAGAIFGISISNLYLLGAIIGGAFGGGIGLFVGVDLFVPIVESPILSELKLKRHWTMVDAWLHAKPSRPPVKKGKEKKKEKKKAKRGK